MGGRGGSSASAGRGSEIDRILAENSGDAQAANEAMAAYMHDRYGVYFTDTVKNGLPAESFAAVCNGMEDVFLEYPSADFSGAIDRVVTTDDRGVFASMGYNALSGNGPLYIGADYKNYSTLTGDYQQGVDSGWSPTGTTVENITSHEMGHALEACLVNSKYSTTADRYTAYNKQTESRRVVTQAANSVRNTSAGKGKSTKTLRSEISKYADSKWNGQVAWCETLAEAVSDYAANGSNAKPLSVAIHDELKSELG